MSLQFVAGIGSAKTEYAIRRMIDRQTERKSGSSFIVVPEQYSMQTQKKLAEAHPSGCVMDIDVLSFNRLAFRVFEETGFDTGPLLDDTGKVLVLRKVIRENRESLVTLGSVLGKNGAVTKMKSLISEFMQYRVSPEDLGKVAFSGGAEPALRYRLNEIVTVYSAFLNYIADHYLVNEKLPETFARLLDRTDFLSGASVLFDGFTGFVPAQMAALEKILVRCHDVTVVLTAESEKDLTNSDAEDLFRMSFETARDLRELAYRNGVPVLPDLLVPEESRGICKNTEAPADEKFNGDRKAAGGGNADGSDHEGSPAQAGGDNTVCTAGGKKSAGASDEATAGSGNADGSFNRSQDLYADGTGGEYPGAAVTKEKTGGDPALKFLARHLFRKESASLPGRQESVVIASAADPEDEMRYAAENILRLVRENGYRYRDIAVVTGDLTKYAETAERVFTENGIPVFTDAGKPVLTNPAVEFVRAAVNMAAEGYTYQGVFRFLKSGMSVLSTEQVDLLETYVLAAGIRNRKAYDNEFTRVCRTMDPNTPGGANDVRKIFAESTAAFAEAMRKRGSTVREKVRAVYDLLVSHDIQRKCLMMADDFLRNGDPAGYREFSQIYRLVIDQLDKMVQIVGDEKTGNAEFSEMIDACFENCRMGLIPPGLDQVIIGDTERSRIADIKVLFLAGVNEGVLPKPAENASMLSAHDRDCLRGGGITLSPDEREVMFRQRFYLYLTMTKPSEKLFLTYSRNETGGKILMPSYLIGVIRNLFPDTEVRNVTESRTTGERVETDSGRREILIRGFQKLRAPETPEGFRELYARFDRDATGRIFLNRLKQAFAVRMPQTSIDRAAAAAIYGATPTLNATRLERFAKCAFAHFLQYGLRLRQREIRSFSPLERGLLLHAALERFTSLVRQKTGGWNTLSEDERITLAGEAFRLAQERMEYSTADSEPSEFYAVERLRELFNTVTWCVVEQVRRGNFTPFAFEMKYQTGGVVGVIDRLDLCENPSGNYLRVIDYKSGKETFSLSNLYYGTKLQLPLYMKAATDIAAGSRTLGHAEPAGIYYFNLNETVEEVESLDTEVQKEKILEGMRLEGFTREDPEILTLTDRTLAPGCKSGIVRITINKDGTLRKGSAALSKTAFQTIYRYTEDIVRRMRERIADGDAAILPGKEEKNCSCDFCEYRGVCRYEERVPGYATVQWETGTTEEWLRVMEERLSENRHGKKMD